MSKPPPSKQCPTCGATLPDKAPEGLCPKCLLLGVAAPTVPDPGAPRGQPAAPALEAVAAAFPQLEIIDLIGQGGMGCVFKARQPQLNRFVALKILPQALARDPAFAARFAREAQALAALNHPNIVTIHDFGEAGGFYFLLMEFVDGVNLRQALSAGRFTPEQALAIVPPICDALQFAHERGVVHRDIKPENLLLDRNGRVKIADFGIATMVAGEGRPAPESPAELLPEAHPVAPGPVGATMIQQTAAGTPQYMAPEQKKDPRRADHRADIYSLGVVLYELLTGELPGARLQPPSRKVEIDVRLDEVVLRALEARPERRYATAAEFRTDLESVTAVAARESLQPASRRNGKWLVPAATVLFFFAGLLVGIPAINGLPVEKESGYLILVAVMFCLTPFAGVLADWALWRRHAGVSRARLHACLKGLGSLAIALALLAIGFGLFFLQAIFGEQGPWNPGLSEALLVPLTWLGSLLLPWAGWTLWRSADTTLELVPTRNSPAGRSLWRRFFVSLSAMAALGLALGIGHVVLKNWQGGRERERPVLQEAMPNETSWNTRSSPTADTVPPVVVQTEPASGTRDVAAGLTEIRVRFSKPMAANSWSWTTAWEDSTPARIGEPHYDPDQRTCVLKAKLEPGRTYAYWLNSSAHRNFQDQGGNPAVPYLLIFQTRAESENP